MNNKILKSKYMPYRIQDYFHNRGYMRTGDAALATIRFIGDCIPSMILLFVLAFIYSCANSPIIWARTAEQKWYAAVETFNLVQEAAIHYAKDPDANPAAVEAMADLSDYGIKIIAIGETIVKAREIDGILGVADQLAGVGLRIMEILASDLKIKKVANATLQKHDESNNDNRIYLPGRLSQAEISSIMESAAKRTNMQLMDKEESLMIQIDDGIYKAFPDNILEGIANE